MSRKAYKYHIKQGHKVFYTGITTTDIEEIRRKYLQNYVDDIGIIQVGEATTLDAALKWEQEQTEKGMPTRRQMPTRRRRRMTNFDDVIQLLRSKSSEKGMPTRRQINVGGAT